MASFKCKFVIGLIAFLTPLVGFAQQGVEIELEPALNKTLHYSGDCGILSSAAAFQAAGYPINPIELFNEKYVSSIAGSSGQDILKAAQDFGVKAQRFDKISTTALLQSKDPWILLLGKGDINAYGHWVALIGVQDDRLTFFDSLRDGSNKIISMSPAEFSIRFSGTGIRVSQHRRVKWVTSFWIVAPIVPAFLLGILIKKSVWSRRHRVRHSRRRYLAILAGSISCLFLIDGVLNPANLVADSMAYSWIHSRHSSLSSERLLLSQIDKNTCIVDARSPIDFYKDSLPGSINIPEEITFSDFRTRIQPLPHSQKLVVFCGNEKCPRAEIVARRLQMAGYKNVSIYPHGFSALQSHFQNQIASNQP